MTWPPAHPLHRAKYCAYCGKPINRKYGCTKAAMADRRTRDHFIPLSRGGAKTRDNLVDACGGCNHFKGALTGWEFLRLRHDSKMVRRANAIWNQYRKATVAQRYARAMW